MKKRFLILSIYLLICYNLAFSQLKQNVTHTFQSSYGTNSSKISVLTVKIDDTNIAHIHRTELSGEDKIRMVNTTSIRGNKSEDAKCLGGYCVQFPEGNYFMVDFNSASFESVANIMKCYSCPCSSGGCEVDVNSGPGGGTTVDCLVPSQCSGTCTLTQCPDAMYKVTPPKGILFIEAKSIIIE